MNTPRMFFAACAAVLSTTCLPAQTMPAAAEVLPEEDDFEVLRVHDPLEGFNRAMFRFNDGFISVVAKPVAKGYEKGVPEAARNGVDNILSNLLFPVRLAGSLLQGKLDRAGRETGRFIVNTTLGFAGAVPVADDMPALKDVPSEDLGQTLGVWGLGHGPYLVLPILGPTTTRDLVGRFGDRYATPWNWTWLPSYEWEWATAAQVTDTLNSLPPTVSRYEAITGGAPDAYIAVRQAYVQFRNFETAR